MARTKQMARKSTPTKEPATAKAIKKAPRKKARAVPNGVKKAAPVKVGGIKKVSRSNRDPIQKMEASTIRMSIKQGVKMMQEDSRSEILNVMAFLVFAALKRAALVVKEGRRVIISDKDIGYALDSLEFPHKEIAFARKASKCAIYNVPLQSFAKKATANLGANAKAEDIMQEALKLKRKDREEFYKRQAGCYYLPYAPFNKMVRNMVEFLSTEYHSGTKFKISERSCAMLQRAAENYAGEIIKRSYRLTENFKRTILKTNDVKTIEKIANLIIYDN
jgi:histone H3/H4